MNGTSWFWIPVLSAMISFSAAAQSEGDIDTEAAKVVFSEAVELYRQGAYAEAAARFRKAYATAPNWKLFYNIAQSEAAAGHCGPAIEMFEKYLAAGGDEVSLDRKDEILKEMTRLRGMVGYLQIVNAPDGASVFVDEVSRGETPLPGVIPITAGVAHSVRVSRDDIVLLEKTVKTPSTMTQTVEVPEEAASRPSAPADASSTTPADEPSPPAPEITPSKRGRKLKIAGLAAGGVGLAALIAGAVTGGVGISLHNELEPHCDGGCPPEYAEEQQKLNRLLVSTDVLLAAGGVAAATGIALFVTGALKDKKTGESLSVSPVFESGFAGATVVGRF